ncbi:hypothetical protein [Leeuwenhoekiella sp. LLG6367-2.1]|uniref:hypothetical protein n=1 Tax=Leeuwenhoekiella sp. LLG6367-2.1 TaxID=3160833 RepID=UPI00386D05B2
MNARMRLLLEQRIEKLGLLKTQLETSKELLYEIKNASVSVQKYEQAATEREIEKLLEQSLEQVADLINNTPIPPKDQ